MKLKPLALVMSLVLLTASVAWAGGIPVGVGGLGTDPHLVFDGNANDPNGITLDIPPFWLDPNGPSLEKWINLWKHSRCARTLFQRHRR